MPVREFVKSDIPQVTKLYWNHLGPRAGNAPAELHAVFAELYFSNPLSDSSPSFVYVDKAGEIVGFLGITTRKMNLSGNSVRVGFGGNFVVHPKARHGAAAPELLDALLGGDQDFLLTDSANDVSKRIVEKVGFRVIPALNIHWARPLRPCQYALYFISHGMKSALVSAGRLAAKPVCSALDRIAGKRWFPLPQIGSDLEASELTADVLLDCLHTFGEGQLLRPEYDGQSLQWLLRFMERNRKRGTLRKTLLRDKSHKIVGWHIYYVKRGAIGQVVQIGSSPEHSKDIFGHLLNDAADQGVIGLHGLADAQKLADLSEQGCFFTCRGGWIMAYSRNSELMDVLQSEQITLSRLDGEWCLNPGE